MIPLWRNIILKPKSSGSILRGIHRSSSNFTEHVLPILFLRPNWGALSKTIGSNSSGSWEKQSNPWQLCVCPPNQTCAQRRWVTQASSRSQSKVCEFYGCNTLHNKPGFLTLQAQPAPSRPKGLARRTCWATRFQKMILLLTLVIYLSTHTLEIQW